MFNSDKIMDRWGERTVRRGAAYLDGVHPGWEEKIDRPINLGSATDCVLGQVFGDYFEHIGAPAPTFRGMLRAAVMVPWSIRHGFAGLAEQAWMNLINERRAAKAELVAEAQNIVYAEYIRSKEAVL